MRLRHTSLIAAAASIATCASADTITFVHEGTGSGTINGTPFNETSFVITSVGDTDDRQSFGGGFWIDHHTSKIAIKGVGEFTFVSGTRTFVNNVGIVGFSREGGGGLDLFNGPFDGVFQTWFMLTSIGPISNSTGSLLQWTSGDVVTDGGVLVFNNQGDIHVTFTATIGSDCYPDCDQSGSLDIDDFICFQTLFALQDPYADCDESGSLDIDDFICFQTFFAIGC